MNYRELRQFLKRGGVIAYPTESCYGLGCDPQNRLAMQRLLRLKGRPQHKGVILVGADVHQFRPYVAHLNNVQLKQLHASWPGPHTWLVPASRQCPAWLTGKHASIAIRVSAHSEVMRLCRGVGMALVSTSANLSGAKSVRSYRECLRQFGGQVVVLPGRVGTRRKPSVIQDLNSGRILRS